HAADARHLPPQMSTGMLKTVASPASDGVAQIHVTAAVTAARALEPRPTHTRHWLIPNDRDAGSIDPNIGRPSGDQAPFFAPLEPRCCTFNQPTALQQVPDVEARVGLDEAVERDAGMVVVFKQSECHQCENKACGRCGIPRELVRRWSEQPRCRNKTIRKLETYQV